MIVLLFTSWNTLVNWILQDKLFFSYLKNKRFLIHHCRSIPVIRNNDTKYIGLSDDDDAIESWWWWRWWWYYRMVWNQKEAPATFRQFASSHEFYSPSTKSEIWFKNWFLGESDICNARWKYSQYFQKWRQTCVLECVNQDLWKTWEVCLYVITSKFPPWPFLSSQNHARHHILNAVGYSLALGISKYE